MWLRSPSWANEGDGEDVGVSGSSACPAEEEVSCTVIHCRDFSTRFRVLTRVLVVTIKVQVLGGRWLLSF